MKLTIVGANAGPQVSSRVGIICEDGSGNALSTGSAYLDIDGAGPFTVAYSTSQTGPWTTINNVGNSLTLNNLVAKGYVKKVLSEDEKTSNDFPTGNDWEVKLEGETDSSNKKDEADTSENSPFAILKDLDLDFSEDENE